MAEAELHIFPGVERRDLGGNAPIDAVLEGAVESKLIEVIVLGKRPDGSMYFAASDGNADAVVGKLFTAMQWLSSSAFHFHGDIPVEEP